MRLMGRICCVVAEKRFLVVFGAFYILFSIAIIRKTSTIETSLDVIRSEEITLNRKARGPSKTAQDEIKHTKAVVNTTPKREPVIVLRATSKREPVKPVADLNPQKSSCSSIPKPTFLEPGKEPLTALHSFPGSGNTWARVLISSLTGYTTGDIYRDGAFSKTPGFSYRKDDTVVAVKTHHPFWDDFNGLDPHTPKGRYWERAVIIVRHPLDATISVFNFFRMKGSHTKIAPLEKYLQPNGAPTKEWNKWAHDQIRNWGRCLDYWINTFKGPKLIIFYEDLRSDLRRQLLVINKFFGFPLNEQRLNCTIESNVQQAFHRNQKIDKRVLYDTSMLNEVEAVLEKVRMLISQNYTHIDTGFSIPPNYAVHLVRENFSMKPNISEKITPS